MSRGVAEVQMLAVVCPCLSQSQEPVFRAIVCDSLFSHRVRRRPEGLEGVGSVLNAVKR